LAVHRSYVPSLLPLLKNTGLHALAHITGGGFPGNINRSLPGSLDAVINLDSWEAPPLFRFLADVGKLSEYELYRTFNMGVGMTLTVSENEAGSLTESLLGTGEVVYEIGRVEPGHGEVRLVHGG